MVSLEKIQKKSYKEEFMKSKIIVLTLAAAFSIPGFVRAQDAADNAPAAPAVAAEQAKPELVKVGNTKCPACGMEIPAADLGKYTVEYNGKVYNVCSPNDQEMFLAQPDRYVKILETGIDPLNPPRPVHVKTEADEAVPVAAPIVVPAVSSGVATATEQK
jgi:YHS domain-containing protein